MSITLVSTTNNDPGAIGWYRKHFTLPPGFAGKKVIVQFDGVYHDSKIYLNGTQVGSQRFGYVSFCCDLTPYLNATGDNVLAVFVDNQTSRRSHFYSGTGIYRHVWLIATDMVHVKNWGTAVTTPKVTAAQSQIRVQTDVVNELATGRSARWKRRFTMKPATPSRRSQHPSSSARKARTPVCRRSRFPTANSGRLQPRCATMPIPGF
jgi:beta-galactosidase/beta-glucuronidase